MYRVTKVFRRPQGLIFLLAISIPSHGQFVGAAAAAGVASGVHFADESSALGDLPIQHSWGIAWADYDRDGWVDLFVNNHWNAPYLLRNAGGFFVDSTVAAGVNIKADHHSCHWADLNSDGALDLYCTTGAKKGTSSEPANFWRNNKNGTFTDIALQTNTVNGPGRGRSVTWADFDGDGDLDLFVGNEVKKVDDLVSILYRNDSGTFTDVAVQSGLNLPGGVKNSVAFDYEEDGDWDLLLRYIAFDENVSPCAACLLIMENDGTGVFTPRTEETTGVNVKYVTALALGDYDSDGHLDIFSGGPSAATKRLLRNNGDGTFSSTSLSSAGFSAVLDAPIEQAVWSDFDNDGFLDLYIVGNDEKAGVGGQPNFLYFNNGDGTFRNGTSTAGAAGVDIGSGSSAAVADYNNDGFPDLVIGNGDGLSLGPYQLLKNEGNSNHWIRVRLVDGQGALVYGGKIWITSGGQTQYREYVDQNVAASFDEPVAHFGLGAGTVVDTLRVEWPDSQVTELTNVAVDQLVELSLSVNNSPATFTSTPVLNANENAAYTYDITTVDPDVSDILLITAPTLPSWLNFDDNGNGTASLTGTPGAEDVGDHSVSLEVTDGLATAVQNFTVAVTGVADANNPPVFDSTPVADATEGTAYLYKADASDADGDSLTITAPTLPAWLTFSDNSDGSATLMGTPGAGDVGDHDVSLVVSDGAGTAEQEFVITVSAITPPPNNPPTFTSTAVIDATEGTTYTYDITTSDADAGDTLTITAPTLPDWLTVNDNGDATAALIGTPAAGDVGDHDVSLEVSDGTDTDVQEFTITAEADSTVVPPPPSGGGGGSLGFLSLLALGTFGATRKRKRTTSRKG